MGVGVGVQAFSSLLSNNLTMKCHDLFCKHGCVWKPAQRTAQKLARGYRKTFAQGLPCFCLQPLAGHSQIGLKESFLWLEALVTTEFFSCSVFSVGTVRLPRLLLCLLTINSFSEVELTSQHLQAHCVRQNSAAQSRRRYPANLC